MSKPKGKSTARRFVDWALRRSSSSVPNSGLSGSSTGPDRAGSAIFVAGMISASLTTPSSASLPARLSTSFIPAPPEKPAAGVDLDEGAREESDAQLLPGAVVSATEDTTADLDATVQVGPTSEGSCRTAAKGNIGTEPDSVPQPTVDSSIGIPESLWKRALNELSSAERAILKESGIEAEIQTSTGILTSESVGAEMTRILSADERQSWKIEVRGHELQLRDIVGKILRWVDKFKAIGDIVVQYDPVHAALPWAAFRFLLQVRKTSPSIADSVDE